MEEERGLGEWWRGCERDVSTRGVGKRETGIVLVHIVTILENENNNYLIIKTIK